MQIKFNADELERIIRDYVETMIDVTVTDVSIGYGDATINCKKNETADGSGYCLTCGHALPHVEPIPA